MAVYPCIACGGSVEIETRGLGPWAAHGLLDPVEIIGDDCVARRRLDVQTEGGRRFVMVDGREFRAYRGGFARSSNPRVANAYHRDDQPLP